MVRGLGTWLAYWQLLFRTLGHCPPRVRHRVMFGQEEIPQVDGHLEVGADGRRNEQPGNTD